MIQTDPALPWTEEELVKLLLVNGAKLARVRQ